MSRRISRWTRSNPGCSGKRKVCLTDIDIASEDQSDMFLYRPAGEDLPVLLQQAPKSLAEGSATVLRGLLDPELEGEINT